MKVVFMGSSHFAIPTLKSLMDSNENVALVVTQPDRPKGRGKKLSPTPVKEFANLLGLKVVQPERMNEIESLLGEMEPDLIVVVSFGQILPKSTLEIPTLGSLNLHPSLLPKYRGAAPLQRVLINGEGETGVTVVWISERLDAGDIFLQERVEISEEENYGNLHDRLSKLGAKILIEAIEKLREGKAVRIPQDENKASYAPPIRREEREIDWKRETISIHNLVRGLSPEPGAFTYWRDKILKILRTMPSPGAGGTPGEILVDIKRGNLMVCCGDGYLKILELQPEGKRVMNTPSFLRGYSPHKGEIFGMISGER